MYAQPLGARVVLTKKATCGSIPGLGAEDQALAKSPPASSGTPWTPVLTRSEEKNPSVRGRTAPRRRCRIDPRRARRRTLGRRWGTRFVVAVTRPAYRPITDFPSHPTPEGKAMPADERTRLRIRQYLIEVIDEQAADAMMESMPPIPWMQLATKDDIAALDTRLGGVDLRMSGVEQGLDSLTARMDQTSSDLQELTRVVAQQGTSLGARMDGIGGRIDALGQHMTDLGRAVTVGAATLAITIAVFIVSVLTTSS